MTWFSIYRVIDDSALAVADFEPEAQCAFVANLSALYLWGRLELPLLRRVNHSLSGEFVWRLADFGVANFSMLIDKNVDYYFSRDVSLYGFLRINPFRRFVLPESGLANGCSEGTWPLRRGNAPDTDDGQEQNQ